MFQSKPGVAVSVRQMQSQPTYDLFFSIRATKIESLSSIDFLIRTQWKYTVWSQIEFNFLAENIAELDANSFNVDTSSLVGCGQDKEVKVLLPFRTPGFVPVKALTYINGFEMTSIQAAGANSPYEVQIINATVLTNGVSLSITVTSVTQVYTIYISIVAYTSALTDVYAGTYTYDTFFPASSLSTQINGYVPTPFAISLYGFSGFIINNNGSNFSFRASLLSNTFSFMTSSSFNYLTFSYFFLNYTACFNCPGYPYYYIGQCYTTCPPNTSPVGFNCNPTTVCPPGKLYNPTTGKCECPPGFYGDTCQIPCTGGRITDGDKCYCPGNTYWNGNDCSIQCPPPRVYNPLLGCICPPESFWNGQTCIKCPPGQVWNPKKGICKCPKNTYWNGNNCITVPKCPPPQQYNYQTNRC